MTKPKDLDAWPSEKQEEWKDRRRKEARAHYTKNKAKRLASVKTWKKNNPDKVRQSRKKNAWKHHQNRMADQRRRYAENPQILQKKKAYLKEHPEYGRANGRRQCERITVAYVAHLLNVPVSLLRANPALFEIKRNHLQTHRLLKTITERIHEPAPE